MSKDKKIPQEKVVVKENLISESQRSSREELAANKNVIKPVNRDSPNTTQDSIVVKKSE